MEQTFCEGTLKRSKSLGNSHFAARLRQLRCSSITIGSFPPPVRLGSLAGGPFRSQPCSTSHALDAQPRNRKLNSPSQLSHESPETTRFGGRSSPLDNKRCPVCSAARLLFGDVPRTEKSAHCLPFQSSIRLSDRGERPLFHRTGMKSWNPVAARILRRRPPDTTCQES